jgi:putative DNA primase/helicase
MDARDGELDLAPQIEAVARRLLGEPNKGMSTRQTLRWGTRGSLTINIAGARRGRWVDFETGERGGVLDFVVRQRGGTRRDALEWVRSEFCLGDVDLALKRRDVPRRAEPEPHKYEMLGDWGRRLWESCGPIIADDPAGRYLQARGCALPHADGDLRWHPALRHPCGHVGQALVALVTDVHEAGRHMSVHRTWISPDGSGRKADIDRPRLLLKDHTKAGGVIRLSPDDRVTYGLGLAEGVETALTLARVFSPVWSCLDAGNLAAFPVLRGIESISVCVDHDAAGLRASICWLIAGPPPVAKPAAFSRPSLAPTSTIG